MAAFEAAVRGGYPVELDVRLLRDGTVVVFHDASLHRMTGRSALVCELDFGGLENLKLASTDEPVPRLCEVLKMVHGRVPLLVELKSHGKVGSLESGVCELLHSYRGLVAVQSFNPWSLAWFRSNAPNIPRGQLSGDFRESDYPFYKKFVLRRMWLNCHSKPDFIGYDHRCLPNPWIRRQTREKYIPILAYTIRSKRDQAIAMQSADNIIFENIIP